MGNQQASIGRGHASPAHAAASGNSATRSSRRSRRSGHAPPTEDVDDNAQHRRDGSYPPTSGQRVGSVSSARLSAPPHSHHPSPHRRRTSANPPAHVFSETASGTTAATAAPPGRLGSHAPSVSSLTTAAPAATALGAAAAVLNSGSGGWEGGYAARHTASSSPEHLTWREHDNDDDGSGNAMSRAASSMRMPNGTLMSADEAASGLTSEGGTPGAPHGDSGAAAGLHVFAAEAVTVATSSVAAAAPSSGGSGGRAGEAEEPNAASSSSSLAAGPRSSPSRSTQGRTRGAPSPPLPPPPPPSSLSLQQRLSEELSLPLIVRASRQGSISAARISIGEESNSNSGGAARQHSPSPEAHPPLPLPPPCPVQTTTSAARSSKKAKKGAKGDAARDGSQDAGAVPSPPPPKHAAGGLMGGLFNPRSSRFLFRKSSSASSSAPASPLQHHDGTRATSSAAAAVVVASPPLSSAQTQASDAALSERVERTSQLPERPAEEAASKVDESRYANEEGRMGVTGEKREVSNSAAALQPAPFVQEHKSASPELPQSPSLALPVSLPEATSTATTTTTRVVSLPLEGAPSWSITHHKTDTDAALPTNTNTTTATATTTAPADAVTNDSGGAVVSLLLPAERSAARSIDGTPLTAAAAAAVDRPSSSFTVKRGNAARAAAALQGFEVAEGSVSEQRTQRDDVGDDSRSRSASSRSSSDNVSGNMPSRHFHQRVHEAVDNDEEEGEATAPTEEVAPRPSAAAAAAAAGDANADAAKEDSHSTTSTDTNSAPILPPPPTASFAEAMWGVRAAARSAVNHSTRREGEGAQPVAAGGGGGSGSALSTSGSSTGPTSSPVYPPRTTHSRSGRGPTAYGATTVTDTTARVSPRSPYSSPPPPLANTAGSESRSPTHGAAHDAAPHLRSRKSVSQSAIIAAWNRMGARSGTLPATTLGPSSPSSGSGGGTRMSSSNGGGGAVEHAATADGACTVAAGSESECHPSLSLLSPPGCPPASQQHGVRGDHDSGSSSGAVAHVNGPISTAEKTTGVVVAPHGAEAHHIAVVPVRRRSVLTRQRGHPSHLVSPPSLKDGDAAEAPPAPREASVGGHGDASPLEPPLPAVGVAEAPHVSAENSSFALSSNVAHMLTVGADEKDGDGARRESLNSAAATTTADEVVPDVAGPPSTPYMATYTLPTFFTFTEAGEQQQQQQQHEEEEARHRGAGEPSISSRPFGGWDGTTPVSAAQERSDHDTGRNPVPSDGALPIPVFVVPAVRVNGTDSASHSRVSSGALDFAESSEASTSATIRIQHTTTDFEGDADGVRTTSDRMDGRSVSETSLVAHHHRSPRSDRRRMRGPLAASGAFTASDAARAASVTVAPLTPRVVHLRRSLSDMSPLVGNDNCNGDGGINASAHANRSAGLVWSNPSSPMARAIAGAYRYASVTPGSDARDAAVEEEDGDGTSDGVRRQHIREQQPEQQEHCASPPTTAAASRSGSASSVSAVGPSAALPGGASPPLNNEAHQRAQQAATSSATAAAAAATTSASARLMPHWRERLTPIQTQSLSPRSSSATRDELALALSGYLHLNSNGGEDSGDYTSLAGSRRRRLSSASQGPPPLAQQLPKSATITTATPPAQQQLPQQMHMQPLHHQLSGSGVQWKEVSLLPSAAGTPSGAAAGLIRSAPEDEEGPFGHRRVEEPSGADTFQVGRLDQREDQQRQQQQQQHHHVGDAASLWSGVESPVLWGEESPRSWQRSNVAEAEEEEEEEMEEDVAELSYRNDVDDDLDEDDDNGYQPVHRLRHLRPPHATRHRPTQQQQQQQQQQHQSNVSGGGALQLHRGGGSHAYLGGFSPRNPPRRYRASSPAEESSLPCTPPDEQRIGDSLRRLLRSGGSVGGGGFLPSSTSDQDIPHNRTFTTSFADGAARMPLTRYEPPMPSNRNTFTAFVPLADISSSHLLASATAIFQGGYQQENSGCSSNSGRPSSGAAANGSGGGGAGSPGAAALRMATSDTPVTADTLLLTGNSSPRMVRPAHGRVAVVTGASGGQLTSPLFSSVSTAATHHVSGGYSPVQGSLSLPVSGGGAVPAQPMHGGEGVERLALPFLVAYTREDEAAATPLPVSVRAGVKPALRSLPQKRKNRVGPAAVGAAPTTAATDTRAAATAESPLLRPAEAEPRLSLNAEAAAPVQAKEAVPAPPSPGTTITTTTTTTTTIRTQESPATSPQSAHASGPAGRSSQRSSGVHSGSDGTRFVEVPEAAQRSSSGSETGLRRHASARALTPHTLSESSCAMVRTNSEPIFAFVPHRAAALYAAPSEEQPWWNRTRLARSDGAGGRSDGSGSRAEGLRIGERSGRSVGAAAAAAATSSSSHAFYCVDDTNAAGGGDDWETEGNVEERCGSPSHSPPTLQTTSVQPHQQHGGEDSEEASEGHRAELLRAMPQFLSVDLCLRLPDAEDSGHSSFSEAGAAGEEGVARGEGEGNHEHGSGGQPISIKLVHSFDFEDDAHDDEEEEENDSESRAVVQETSRLNGDSDGEGSRLVNTRAPTVMWRQGDPLSESNSQEPRPATVGPHTSSLAAEACGDWDQGRRVREAVAVAAVGHASEHTPSRSTGSTANSADAAVFEVRRDTLMEAEAYTRACIAESADAVRATWAAVWAALQRAATAMAYDEEGEEAATPLATSPASSPDVLTRLTSAPGSPTSVAPPPLSVPVLLAGAEVSRNAKRKKAGDVVARTAAGEDRGPAAATAAVLNVAETPPVLRVAGLRESTSSPHVSAVAPAAAHTPNALSVAEHATPSSFLIGPSSTSFRTPDNTPSVQTDGTETAEEAAGDSVGPSAVQGRSSGDTASGPVLSTFNEGSATRQDTAVAAAAAARQRGTAPVGRVLSSPTPPPSPTRITVLAHAAAAGAASTGMSNARGASPDPFPPPQPTAGDVNTPHVTIVAPLYTDLRVRRRASSSSATASSPSPHSPYQEHAAASSASLTSSQLHHHHHPSHTRSSTRRPSMGHVVCRWCGDAYSSAVTCPVAQRPHSVLRAERKREKAAKREAQALLCDGRVAEAVALLRQVGLYVP